MSKTLIALFLALTLAGGAYAETPDGPPGPGRGPNVERLAEKLKLTDEQKTKLQALFDEQKKQHEALRENMKTQLKGVLTPEQLTQFEAMHDRRHGGKWHDCKPPRE